MFPPSIKNFGKAVSLLRKEKSWTQEFLSKKTKLNKDYISRVELGKQNISLQSIRQISEALDIPVSKICMKAELLENNEQAPD